VLGRREPSGFKADKGSCTHKALELLATKKVALQEGRATFSDPELGPQEYDAEAFGPEDAIGLAYKHYSEGVAAHHDWAPADYRDCRSWMYKAMTYNGGAFNPLRRTVIWPEKFFEIDFEGDWAKYSYPLPGGKTLAGRLGMKGTIDLVCRAEGDPSAVEMVDWKTGLRKDWATGKTKDYQALRKDIQLRMYHLALCRLLPQVEHILITIVFIRDGGAFTVPLSRADLPETEDMLRRRFDAMRNCQKPRLIWDDAYHSWKCRKLCHFGKTNWPGTDKLVCHHVRDELVSLGMEKVTAKYADMNKIQNYGSGGGRQEKPADDTLPAAPEVG
jgi:hypothetical protein